jgi:hypothetical protein
MHQVAPTCFLAPSNSNYEQFNPHVNPHSYDIHLWTFMHDESHRRLLVSEEPTTMQETPTQVALSQICVLNGEPCLLWRITKIKNVNKCHVTYAAQGINNQGWVNIMVPREWSMDG